GEGRSAPCQRALQLLLDRAAKGEGAQVPGGVGDASARLRGGHTQRSVGDGVGLSYPLVVMAIAVSPVGEQCRAARAASRRVATLDTATKNAALRAIAAALIERTPEILRANALDMQAGR